MSSPKKVAVVILSWNGIAYLEQFLPSVVLHTNPQLCEIVVADNSSTDGSIEFVKKNYPNIRVIQNCRNSGYTGGYNEALKQINSEYYILLNQDIEVTEKWVEKIIDELDKNPAVAAAQPKLLSYRQRDEFEYAGASGGYLDKWCYAFCRGRLFSVTEKDRHQYDDVVEVFWASGACMFVRSSSFWEAGGLDEDFFAHQEEIDLCWRLQNMGYKILAVPSSVVYHVGGGSLSYGNPKKAYLNFRNNLMMMLKNLPATELWKIPFRFVLDFMALIQAIVKERGLGTAVAIHKAHLHFLAAIPSLLKKRKKIPHQRRGLLYKKSVVWQHFVLGKKHFSEL